MKKSLSLDKDQKVTCWLLSQAKDSTWEEEQRAINYTNDILKQ